MSLMRPWIWCKSNVSLANEAVKVLDNHSTLLQGGPK